MLETLDTIENTLGGSVKSILKNIIDITDGKEELKQIFEMRKLPYKTDDEFFKAIDGSVDGYISIIPELRKRIMDEIPGTTTTNTSNINVKLTYAILSLGIFLSTELINIMEYLLANNYNLEQSELPEDMRRDTVSKLDRLIQILPEVENAKLLEIVKTIGNIPVIKPLRGEVASVIPDTVITSFFEDTFDIKSGSTLDILKRVVTTFSFNKTGEVHEDLVSGFVGNPIMYFRMFLVDIRAMRLNYSRDRIRLLENRVLELRQNVDGLPTEKVVKAIKHYEELVTKHQYKIERLSKVY